MRRFIFHIFIALITFGISSFFAFQLLSKTVNISPKLKQESQVKATMQNTKTENSVDTFSGDMTTPFFNENTSKENERKVPFCNDKRILPVWNLIKKDEYFREQSGESFVEPNCSDMFEILKFDLNKDGYKEIILRGKSSDLCGAVGNCGFWIFGKKGKNFRKLLSSSDYYEVNEIGHQINTRITNGYCDILLKGHWNSSDTVHRTYKFNGRKYVESKCLVDTYIRGTAPDPKWGFLTCREHEKRGY